MKTHLKLGKITFSLEAVKAMDKETFIKEGHAGDMDPERTWNRLQKEINTPEVEEKKEIEGEEKPATDVSKPAKRSRKNK